MAGIAVVDSDDSTLWKFSSGRVGEIISRICAALMATVDELVGSAGLCGGGGGGAGAAGGCCGSGRLGDGVFLRVGSGSVSKPGGESSRLADVGSRFEAACALASTYDVAAS